MDLLCPGSRGTLPSAFCEAWDRVATIVAVARKPAIKLWRLAADPLPSSMGVLRAGPGRDNKQKKAGLRCCACRPIEWLYFQTRVNQISLFLTLLVEWK